MARTLALLLVLAGCETAPIRPVPPAPTPADSALRALRDSLHDAETARRQQAAASLPDPARERRRLQHQAALWALASRDDWSGAHDSVLIDAVYRVVDEIQERRGATDPDSPRVQVPPVPLDRFRTGMPRSLDRFAQLADSVAARYGVADRVRVEARTDTLVRTGSLGGLDLYAVSTETTLAAADGSRLRVSSYDLGYPRWLHAVLAVRGGRAQALVLHRGPGGIGARAEATPLGPILVTSFNAQGARFYEETFFRRRDGRWQFLGRDWDLQLDPVPPFASAYRDRELDLEALELRASVEGIGSVGFEGCLVAPIRLRRGRLATGAAVWRRDVESCGEYAFRPSETVRHDTSRIEVANGHLGVGLHVAAGRDTTTAYRWRLLDPAGRERWAGVVPRGGGAGHGLPVPRACSGVRGVAVGRRRAHRAPPLRGDVAAPPRVAPDVAGAVGGAGARYLWPSPPTRCRPTSPSPATPPAASSTSPWPATSARARAR